MHAPPSSPPPPPLCPRCAYDLSGVPPTWRTHCDLDGTCSECGLRFQWADILGARGRTPRWSFEHRLRPNPIAFFATALRCLRPRTLWRGIRLESRIAVPRLLTFAAAMLLAMHAAAAGAAAWILHVRQPSWWPTPTPEETVYAVLAPYSLVFEKAPADYGFFFGWWWAMLAPLSFLAIPTTLRRCRVRRAHLLRVWAYSLVAVVPMLMLLLLLRLGLTQMAGFAFFWRHGDPLFMFGYFAPLFIGVWITAFWYSACKRYLRLPRTGIILPTMMFICFLASLTICAVLAGSDLAIEFANIFGSP